MRTWLRRGLWALAALLLARAAVSLAIQLFPAATPVQLRSLLTSGWRRRYRDPPATVGLLGLRPGARVLELGPGPGLFTPEAARAVGDGGLVVAVDLQLGMLLPLRRALDEAGARAAAPVCGAAERLPLAGASVDAAFAIAVLPMLADKRAALRELRRVMRPGAELVVSEDLVEPEYVPAWLVERWCRAAGFALVERRAEPLWYMLRFRAGGGRGE